MAKQEFIVLFGQVCGDGDKHPFKVFYDCVGRRFVNRSEAISHGLKVRDSDDFNIGVLMDGKLVSLDWMTDVVDTDTALMAEISEQIAL